MSGRWNPRFRMIQLVFVFGVVLPTLITVACFIGFLVCWFRFRSLKRHHVTDRKSTGAACPRRCRVYVASSSPSHAGTCSYRTARCFCTPTGSRIPSENSTAAGWLTRVVDHGRNSVVLPLTTDVIDIDMPSTAPAEVRRAGMSIKHPDSRSGNFRPISGLRPSITSPGLLSTHQECSKIVVCGALAKTGSLANADEVQPDNYTSGSELQMEGCQLSSRSVIVDACYVDVEPITPAASCPTTSCRHPRIPASKSIDDAVSKVTRSLTTTSGLSGDRKYYWSSGDNSRTSTTHEIPRLAHTRRHHSLAEVPHHGALQIKTGDETSLDFWSHDSMCNSQAANHSRRYVCNSHIMYRNIFPEINLMIEHKTSISLLDYLRFIAPYKIVHLDS